MCRPFNCCCLAQLSLAAHDSRQIIDTNSELEKLRAELARALKKIESKKRVFKRFSESTAKDFDSKVKELELLQKEYDLLKAAVRGFGRAFLSKSWRLALYLLLKLVASSGH